MSGPTIEFQENTKLLILDNIPIMFSNLKEPKGFKADDAKKFNATFRVEKDHVDTFTANLNEIEEKVIKAHKDYIEKTEGKSKVKGLLTKLTVLKDVLDRDTKKETGDARLEARRREVDGPPKVADKDGTFLDTDFVPFGSIVRAVILLRPYVMNGVVGVSFQLMSVVIRKEPDGKRKGSGPKRDLTSDVEKAMFDFDKDLDKLPF